jgi:hypothetical protein
MTQWQPIETAPKDGTEVLMYHPELGCAVWPSTENNGLGTTKDVTHWMPLPEPPEES